MKDFLSPLAALVAASSLGGAVAADNFLHDLASSLEHPANLQSGDWTDALACTADMANPQNPTVIDQATCATSTDANGKPCVWCDATKTLGQGICVGPDQKAMIGPYWDQLCAAGGTVPPPPAPTPFTPPAPVTPPPTTAKPTPLPTPPPTQPAPAPGPGPDNVPDDLKCAMDASQSIIADEATCVARVDPTSASGAKCVWCDVPVLGGSCITNTMKEKVGFFCSNGEEDAKVGNLRGETNNNHDNNSGVRDFRNLDPACLAGDNTQDGCDGRKDSTGGQCVWCDAAGVFGVCAAQSQREYLATYMDCEEVAGAAGPPVAVE